MGDAKGTMQMTMKIGAVVRTGPLAHGAAPPRYEHIRNIALQFEQGGLDSIWLFDHLLYRWPGEASGGMWECWTMLTALAEATQRVELGTIVLCTAFRNPAVLAKMAAALDEVSNGRLTLGLGAGWHKPEFDAFGIPFDHRASRFEEAIAIIKPLLRTGRVNLRGTYHSAPNCELIPRGPRDAGPPLLLAGNGPRMLHFIAREADVWNTAWHAEPASAEPALARMRTACETVGRDPATLQLTAGLAIVYPDLGGRAWSTRSLTGDTRVIAESLHGYAELGIAHLIIDVSPFSPEGVDRIVEAVDHYRVGVGA